jgi:hypothetical protein
MSNKNKVLIFAGSFVFWGALFIALFLLTRPAIGSSNISYTPTDAEVQQWEDDLNNHIPAPCKNQNYWQTQIGTGDPTWDDFFRFKADSNTCPG